MRSPWSATSRSWIPVWRGCWPSCRTGSPAASPTSSIAAGQGACRRFFEQETGEDREELPPLPDDDVTGFRAEAWRRLSPAEFARVDAVYGRGLDAACRWLADQPQERSPLEFVPRHYLRSLFPAHLRPDEVAAGVALLQAHYPAHLLRSLAQGLLCVGSSPFRASTKFPRRWDDGAALQRFLVELVTASPSRRHSIARLRGAQAGALLHGLLLVLPGDLVTAGGPGLSGLPLTAETAAAIRARVASPVHAAALATALFTGLAPIALGEAPISALAPDAATLTLALHPGTPAATICVLPVPPAARPLLSAARIFLTLRGTPADKRLLASGTGGTAQYLQASAAACGLALPLHTPQLVQSWQVRTAAWWVGTHLHHTTRTPQ
ncbi:hypothetical protein [Amycolatopsis magusensis]|uniref:hypothetical protein n=1 Tax=Amycolatopsis magusensis TaxID=882444 RepID=UPI0024A8529E|nr:hypothetical protein [Amycolatopsis magusensis]MDI5978245.1 hypothetical protein [Amycolatopsis magusensis]